MGDSESQVQASSPFEPQPAGPPSTAYYTTSAEHLDSLGIGTLRDLVAVMSDTEKQPRLVKPMLVLDRTNVVCELRARGGRPYVAAFEGGDAGVLGENWVGSNHPLFKM
jgi:hypothetical protein